MKMSKISNDNMVTLNMDEENTTKLMKLLSENDTKSRMINIPEKPGQVFVPNVTIQFSPPNNVILWI
jgi:hypothetical protein